MIVNPNHKILEITRVGCSKQNKTHAVMSQRHEDKESKDYFPTPPWATRALFEKV